MVEQDMGQILVPSHWEINSFQRWIVPGWRLGWIFTTDPKNILEEKKGVFASFFPL
jgi:hypothetical protein